jgi:uncharacterized Rmd1/YagE family protein
MDTSAILGVPIISSASKNPDQKLVRLFRKGPVQEQLGFTVYSKCIADSIDTALIESSSLFNVKAKRLRPKSATVVHARIFENIECFVFGFGCIVVWGCSRPQMALVIEAVLQFATKPLILPTEDKVTYCSHLNRTDVEPEISCIRGDTILLSTDTIYEKMAYSYALAQGVKLDVFEQILSEKVDKIGEIPAELFETGVVPLSTTATSARLGEVFLLQYEVNLHSDVVESPPDTFWDFDILLPVYLLCRGYLDVDHRVTVLNKRLKFMRGFYSMLQSEAQVRDTVKLDWIVILGVIGEVVVAAMQMAILLYQYFNPMSTKESLNL